MKMNLDGHSSGKLIALAVLVGAVLLGIWVIHKLDTEPRTDDAYAYADTIFVTPEVSGRIIELAVKDNQAVKEGDIILRIDPRPYEQALAMAVASLQALEREMELTQRLNAAQKYTADAAEASVVEATAAVNMAAKTLKRVEPLLGQGYVSAEQVDQARTALQAAKAQQAAAVFAAQSALSAVGDVQALKAKRDALLAEVALAEINLSHTTVRAPFEGRVIGLKTTTGHFAAAGVPLFVLADTRQWYVIANFRETELTNTRPGSPAVVYLMGDTNKVFKAKVESIGYGVHAEDSGMDLSGLPRVARSINWVRVAQRFPVRFVVEDPDPEMFRIGASAVAVILGPPPEGQ